MVCRLSHWSTTESSSGWRCIKLYPGHLRSPSRLHLRTIAVHFGLNGVMFLQLSSPTLFPQNKSNLKPKYHPYLTADLLHLVRKKLRLFRFAKQTGTTTAWSKYTKIRNRLTSALRSAKKAYFHQMAASISSPREFWSCYHKLNPKYSRTPASLHHYNTKAITSIGKATLLNSFFTGCFTTSKPFLPNLLSSLPPSSKPTLSSVECTHDS